MPSETKMAPGRRDRGVVYVKVFDWLSWFPCMWTACDHHSLLLQWRHMTVWPLMWLVQLWHITIWPLMWLVQLWKVPRKTPLLAYINQEFVAIKQNCLDGTPVVCYCLWLAEGVLRGTFHSCTNHIKGQIIIRHSCTNHVKGQIVMRLHYNRSLWWSHAVHVHGNQESQSKTLT